MTVITTDFARQWEWREGRVRGIWNCASSRAWRENRGSMEGGEIWAAISWEIACDETKGFWTRRNIFDKFENRENRVGMIGMVVFRDTMIARLDRWKQQAWKNSILSGDRNRIYLLCLTDGDGIAEILLPINPWNVTKASENLAKAYVYTCTYAGDSLWKIKETLIAALFVPKIQPSFI